MKTLLAIWLPRAALAVALVCVFSSSAFAQEAAESPTAYAETSASASDEAPPRQIDRGDNAWMLVSSALVLSMTTPGLAMFYGGLVRKKNVVTVLMQCITLMGLMTGLWGTVGYSLAFGGGDAWLGNGDYLFMNGVQGT